MIVQTKIITNAQIVTPNGLQTSDILIEGQIIKEISVGLAKKFPDAEQIDAHDRIIIPGVIDTQVHFRWPGLTHKEDLASGSTAALLGGVTTFLEMPNTKPSTTSVSALEEKVERAKLDSKVDFGFFMGGTRQNLAELKQVETLAGCCGIKIFFGSSTGDLLLHDMQAIEAIFTNTNCIIAIHSEDEDILQRDMAIRDSASSVLQHEKWRSVESALVATTRILALAKKVNRKVHILHVTTKEEMKLLAQNKQWATVEVTPQHLTLYSPDCFERLGTIAQMNPPIRTKDHQDGLWEGVRNHTVNVIGSDHAPHTLEEKGVAYPRSPSGMPGVQTMLSLMFHHHLEGRLSLQQMVDLLCHNPAKLYDLHDRGSLAVGKIASLVALNPKETTLIENNKQASKTKHTPFHGMLLQGSIDWVMHRGVLAVQNGRIINPTYGCAINSLQQRRLKSTEKQ
jgi:dihydroorotase